MTPLPETRALPPSAAPEPQNPDSANRGLPEVVVGNALTKGKLVVLYIGSCDHGWRDTSIFIEQKDWIPRTKGFNSYD